MAQRRIRVYVSPACPFSVATVSFLMLEGADFEVVNLETHPEALERLKERLGKVSRPTIEVGDALHVAPSLSDLGKLLAEWKVPSDAAPMKQLKADGRIRN